MRAVPSVEVLEPNANGTLIPQGFESAFVDPSSVQIVLDEVI